jgi:hypothetical protein
VQAFLERMLSKGYFVDAGDVVNQALMQLNVKISQTLAQIQTREASGETLEEIGTTIPGLDS